MDASTSTATELESSSMDMGRLRSKKRVNYREANDVRIPRAERTRSTTSNELYPVHVVERQGAKRVKVHYVGYSSAYDEWRDESELESIEVNEVESSEDTAYGEHSFEPFSLNKHLMLKIKQSLSCSRRSSPAIKIVVPFDAVHFNGGLKLLATPSKKVQGIQHYTIKHYEDLNPLLGKNWHYRGLNSNGDYGYVVLETIDFCIRKCKPLEEYVPAQEDGVSPCVSFIHTGYILAFSFICGYGSLSTFGKDKKIFY